MPVTKCQAFVENAWKKDLCSNCFKSQEEHGGGVTGVKKVLTGQDSLTELQQGQGRYFTLTPQFTVNSRYKQQVHKWNDTVLQQGELGVEREERDSRDSQDRSLGEEMGEQTAGVIERLDSLVLGCRESTLSSLDSQEEVGSMQGILRKERDKKDKTRRISFPDYEELQEIIGYGGDMYYSSEDEEPVPEVRSEQKTSDFPEEMTAEERSMLSATKKNTTFNSHAPNLKDPTSSPPPRLGVDKKHTPVISVRPFVREKNPGRVNMVSPMINGELVSNRKDSALETSVRKLVGGEEGSSRGEAKTMKTDRLGSDGSTENSASDSDSVTRDSPPPERDISLSAFDMKRNNENLLPINRDASSFTKQSSFLSTQIEEQKAKSSAATERLSFLSGFSSLDHSTSAVVPAQKVKPSHYKDEHVTKLTAAKAKLSLPNTNSSLEPEEAKVPCTLQPADEQRAKCSAATARLSFLNSTMGEGASACGEEAPVIPLISLDNAGPAQDQDTAKSHPKSKTEKVVEEGNAIAPAPEATSGPKRNDSSRDSPKVKLSRKSPYVTGPYTNGTAILKGTPKPMITRKPPILKDKPKVPLKPNKLMMRSPSSSPSPTPHDEGKRKGEEEEHESQRQLPERRGRPEEARSPPSPAPRKSSFRRVGESPCMSLAPSLEPQEVYSAEGCAKESVIISVSASESVKLTDSLDLNPAEKTEPEVANSGENSPPQVQKNLALKNREALEAIRQSLSNKLIGGGPPARVVESIRALESGSAIIGEPQAPAAQRVTSNSFEEARSSIANALQFNGNDNLNRSSTKRQAPMPPEDEEEEDEEHNAAIQIIVPNETFAEEEKSTDIATEEVNETVETKLAPAIRNSSMKSADSCKNKDSKPRSVQFNPETVTVTVPANNPTPKVISYNRWIGHGPGPRNTYGPMESSFTGQPIAMYPPGVISGHQGPLGKKTPLPLYAPVPIIDDEPRKWTEKKNKWRSKSTPRSSEIDEIMGSSKTKSSSRMGIFSPSSPQPIKRQSRVEMYESERKGQLKKGSKFSLKKLFRGSLPEGMEEITDNKSFDKEHEREILERQKMKVRPEIIHPLDLMHGGGVEVVKIMPQNTKTPPHHDKHKNPARTPTVKHPESRSKSDSDSKDSGHDTSSIHTETSEGSGGSGDRNADFSLSPLGAVPQADLRELCGSVGSLLGVNSSGKPKPAPPPRSQSLDTIGQELGSELSPDTSPDPFPEESTEHEEPRSPDLQPPTQPPAQEPTIYANLGQLRSSLAPHKPHRTASMREAEGREERREELPRERREELARERTEEALSPHFHTKTASMSGSVDSEAGSDSSLSLPSSSAQGKARDGSEADSERDSVSPQRSHEEALHYGEEGSPVACPRKRSSRLSMRKGRSIVHKNLEDNYGAVITANHEAIAQILEQVCQNRPTPPALRSLAAAMNLRFADFSVLSESEGLRTEKRAFFPATWGGQHLPVTLMVSKDMALNNINLKNSFALTPIAQFVDQVPSYLVAQALGEANTGNKQAVVWALARLQVLQFGAFSRNLKQRRKSLRLDEFEKDMSFVLLQLINGLKFLQAQGIEETIADLDNFLLARSDNDTNHRLIITEECHKPTTGTGTARMSLCQCALAAMLQLFDISSPVAVACEPHNKIELPQIIPSVSMFKTMAVILQQGGSVSLGQVKSMLEYMLWGPSDIIFDLKMGREAESREEALQRWLDLERATVLNNLIRTQGLWNIQLTVYEEYHLLFLVRTCAKMLREASLLFESEVSRM